jgi:hypothetical protein
MAAPARPYGSVCIASAFALTLFAACSEPPPAEQATTDPVEAAPAPSLSRAQQTTPGDGAFVELKPLTEQDLAGKLPQELGCSFIFGEVHAILVAKGNVDKAARSYAVVSNDGVAEELQSTTTGGYDGMVEGVTFGGKSLTVEIAKLDRQATGTEQVAHTAQLTARRADGAERVYPGLWTCGP